MRLTCITLAFKEKLLGSVALGKSWPAVVPQTFSFMQGIQETCVLNIWHGEALPSFPPLHRSQRHSLVLFVTDQCIYPCGKMSLPPGLGFSFPLNRPCCAGEGLANCLFSQVAPGDGCPTACHTSQLHSQSFPQQRGCFAKQMNTQTLCRTGGLFVTSPPVS